jgi:hypothetical protein
VPPVAELEEAQRLPLHRIDAGAAAGVMTAVPMGRSAPGHRWPQRVLRRPAVADALKSKSPPMAIEPL